LYQNVSIFDGRDACSTNVWKVDDFETSGDSDSNDTNLIHIITYLKPYTQYALYVKTYTIASETKGAQSDILYFKTQPDTPSQPRSLSARPQTSSEIMIEWEEPTHLNGEVTHYVVTGTRDEDFISKRNYCLEPVTHDTSKKVIPEEESKIDHWKKNSSALNESIKEDSETCCSCKKTSITEDDTEVEKRISFEDYLINSIYIKRYYIISFSNYLWKKLIYFDFIGVLMKVFKERKEKFLTLNRSNHLNFRLNPNLTRHLKFLLRLRLTSILNT
jgi:insulin receptor